jgi:putative restriction endonuclease
MANLDGSRRNGAKHEVEVAARLLASPGELGRAYRTVLEAARDEGIDASVLPDFLALIDDQADLLLLGQEELADVDIEADVEGASARWLDKRHDLEERVTQRLLVAVARVGQHRFASEVLRNHQHQCVFCGLAVRTEGVRVQRMLVASHIKPWRVSSAAERLDARNGLTACPTHDVAFDIGLLTVNGGLRIHVVASLDHAARFDPAARAAFGRPPLAERLLLPPGAPHPKVEYLSWHHRNVFREPALVGVGSM